MVMKPAICSSRRSQKPSPSIAGAATSPRTFEEAGRLVDELAGRLSSFGADLVQQIQGRGGMGPGRMMGDPTERPLITIMLHHRTELGLTPEQVIAEALARPAPETPDGKAFVPPGGFAPPKVN